VLDWSLLLAEMESSDFDLLSQYLKKLKCNVVDLADDNGFTLLHHAVLKGQDGKVQQVVDMALAIQKPTEQQIKKWCDIRS
jgi:ankyrin repeat protein